MPPLATPAFLTSLRSIPHLPPNTWYYLASVAFAVLNRPTEIPRIYSFSLTTSPAHETLNRTREALLKASAIGGFPSIINALNALKTVVPEDLLDAPSPTARARDGVKMAEGDQLWDSIYGEVGPRVMRGMRRSYDDLGGVARLVYAGILADDKVLGKKETGFVLVAGLVTGGQAWGAQEKGHRRGCVNNGATWAEVEAVEMLAGRVVEEVRNAARETELVRGLG
ncbi:AhpD-like protein [Trichophaea hybrida]|nr:AhpD-like protein [Trichophaea hybrida]